MRTLVIAVCALALTGAANAFANGHDADPNLTITGLCGPATRLAPRRDLHDARCAITTEDDGATLILTGDRVALQLSDHELHDVRRKLRSARFEGDNALAQVINSVVLSSVGSLLDHSVECPLREIEDVEYRDGRLVLVTFDGDHLFEGVDINDHEVLESFSDQDARTFLREYRRARSRSTF
jgi:hypothetical protein